MFFNFFVLFFIFIFFLLINLLKAYIKGKNRLTLKKTVTGVVCMSDEKKKKEIRYICPKCFLIQDKIEVYADVCEVQFYENGFYGDYDILDFQVVKIILGSCGCMTQEYDEEDLEIEIDNEKKTVNLLSDFENYEFDIKERNPEYKDYKFIYR